jgi:hypothetical protein
MLQVINYYFQNLVHIPPEVYNFHKKTRNSPSTNKSGLKTLSFSNTLLFNLVLFPHFAAYPLLTVKGTTLNLCFKVYQHLCSTERQNYEKTLDVVRQIYEAPNSKGGLLRRVSYCTVVEAVNNAFNSN